jgi:hypothetical protein
MSRPRDVRKMSLHVIERARHRTKERCIMLHTEKAELLPARQTLGFWGGSNFAIVHQGQLNVAGNLGGAHNFAFAGGRQTAVVIQF